MAVAINQHAEWKAGLGTPIKYSVDINATTDFISMSGNTATFNLIGSVTLSNHPNNSQNSFQASDYAVLSIGTKNPADYNFSAGTDYYQRPLPFLPNAPQDYVDGVIMEFRGDTFRPNPNRSSLYLKGVGVVANAIATETTETYNINTTYQVELSGAQAQPILAWIRSGTDSTTTYNWLDREVWVYWSDFDYRPGMIWDGNTWQSHNRSNGWAGVYDGSTYKEMRTLNGGSGTGNPPSIRHDNDWRNMRKIGANG